MEDFLHSQAFNWVLIGLVLAIGVTIFYLWSRHKKRKPAKSSKPETEVEETGIDQFVAVEARVYDNETRTAYNATIPGKTVREIRQKCNNLGRKWLKDGKWLYALNKKESGQYVPVSVPQTMENPPSELHRALMQQEIDIVYNVDQEKSFAQKWGHVLLFTGACVAVLALFILQRMQS